MSNPKRLEDWMISLAVGLTLSVAFSQEFVFTSDRVPRENVPVDAGGYTLQNDLFIYRDGSELRLTHTDDLSEYDAVPSPDGRLIAYASTTNVYPVPFEEARWTFKVIDAVLGHEVASWLVPNSQALLRPAGGFQLTWMPDGSAFFAQVPGAKGTWEIRRFEVGDAERRFITEGFGIALSPSGESLATERRSISYVVDLSTGDEDAVAGGSPLAWLNDSGLLVARNDGLYSVDVVLKREVQLFDYQGSYGPLVWSPDRQHYAFSLLQDQNWYLLVVTREHDLTMTFRMPSAIESLDWLLADRVLTSYLRDSTFAIAAFTLDGNELLLVDSWADDGIARAIPR